MLEQIVKKKKKILSRYEKDKLDEEISNLLEKKGLSSVLNLFPQELLDSWKALFGAEHDRVIKYSFKPLPKVVRINKLKIGIAEFKKMVEKYSWKIERVGFFPSAFLIKEEGALEKTKEYQEGLFYIQQLSSMLTVLALDPKPNEKILDIGAAPGSKTTLMAEMMKNKGEIIAVDISKERLEILKNTLTRLGVTNVKPVLKDGTKLGEDYFEKFDRILLDGPCSCEGIIRYKAHKIIEWDSNLVKSCSLLQKRLILSAFKSLKLGGTLVYSTCTYNPEENEAVINYLLKNKHTARVQIIKFTGIKTRRGLVIWGEQNFDKTLSQAVRIYPQDFNSTGFFICKIRKLQP